MLDLKQGGGADLSRRAIEYHLPVWSFREYLNLRCGWQLKTATLDEVLKGKVDFPYGAERPLMYFDEYMKKGCYPFSLEPEFETRLRQVVNTTVELDIPKYAQMTIAATQKLKKFMYYISKSVPVKINYSDMARDLALDREDLPKYLEYIIQICLMFCLARNQTMAILVKSYSCAGPNICTTPWNRRSVKK